MEEYIILLIVAAVVFFLYFCLKSILIRRIKALRAMVFIVLFAAAYIVLYVIASTALGNVDELAIFLFGFPIAFFFTMFVIVNKLESNQYTQSEED